MEYTSCESVGVSTKPGQLQLQILTERNREDTDAQPAVVLATAGGPSPPQSAMDSTRPRPQHKKQQRGRRPKYIWNKVITGLGAKLAADGIPVPGDGSQAKLEEWATQQFGEDSCPSESMIRAKVAEVIVRHREALGLEANN